MREKKIGCLFVIEVLMFQYVLILLLLKKYVLYLYWLYYIGGQVSLFSMTLVWLVMLTISTTWVFTCLRAMQHLDEDDVELANQKLALQLSNGNSRKKAISLRSQVCSFFGAKVSHPIFHISCCLYCFVFVLLYYHIISINITH